MPSSHESPSLIQIDFGSLKNGVVSILVHWDIIPVDLLNSFTNETCTMYEYEEVRMNWILPELFTSKEEIQSYFDANYDQGETILNWAQASKITYAVDGFLDV